MERPKQEYVRGIPDYDFQVDRLFMSYYWALVRVGGDTNIFKINILTVNPMRTFVVELRICKGSKSRRQYHQSVRKTIDWPLPLDTRLIFRV